MQEPLAMHPLAVLGIGLAVCAAFIAAGFAFGGKQRAIRVLIPLVGFVLGVAVFWGVAFLVPHKKYGDVDAAVNAANNATRISIFCGIAGALLGFVAGDFVTGNAIGRTKRRP